MSSKDETSNNYNNKHNHNNRSSVPGCVYETNLKLFRIFREGGKILTAGFGVAYTTNNNNNNNNHIHHSRNPPSPLTQDPPVSNEKSTSTYLFIEEALFLHERGLLQVYFSIKNKSHDLEIPSCLLYPGFTDKKKKISSINMMDLDYNTYNLEEDVEEDEEDGLILMDTQDLYTLMLHELHIPLAVYITYSHLRSQSYIVVRHFQQRLAILEKQQQQQHKHAKISLPISNKRKNITAIQDVTSQNNSNMAQVQEELDKENIRIQLRQGTFYAPVPKILDPAATTDINQDSIAFHVYDPTSTYRKTNPGLPTLLVAITYFQEPQKVSFHHIYSLTKACQGINLRLATVSDSGTVIMFGITDFGVPYMEEKIEHLQEEKKLLK